MFQSTPSRGGRPETDLTTRITKGFQSTPSRGGRPTQICNQLMRFSFNPRPHAEGDRIGEYQTPNSTVSIHALTRRATCRKLPHSANSSFQSTPSRGGRQEVYELGKVITYVSIHALTRRATKRVVKLHEEVYVSIHALTRRATKP